MIAFAEQQGTVYDGILYMAEVRRRIGKPWQEGELRARIRDLIIAAKKAEGLRIPEEFFRQPGPATAGRTLLEKIIPGFEGIREKYKEDPQQFGRVVGGWAARIGAVVITGIATFYTGGATAPLLVSSLNTLMQDPATTSWGDDLSAFVMASEIVPPDQQPAELQKVAPVAKNVNSKLWELPPERRNEILSKGTDYLLKMAAKEGGPEAVEEMKGAIARYLERGQAGQFGFPPTLEVIPEESFIQKHRKLIGVGIVLVAGGIVGTIILTA
jgi:hypothetical protein